MVLCSIQSRANFIAMSCIPKPIDTGRTLPRSGALANGVCVCVCYPLIREGDLLIP